MGNNICCEEKEVKNQKKIIKKSIKAIEESDVRQVQNDELSTSQSPKNKKDSIVETVKSPLKSMKTISFVGYLMQKQVSISQIKPQQSGQTDWCSEQKILLSYLERLSKQIQTIRKQNDPKLQKEIADKNQKININEKRFIEHASKCPVCNQLYENLKNVEIQESHKTQNPQFKRKSLRDSLLEFVQEEKVITTEEQSYLNLHSYQEAKKAMKKYPNTNIYQCKRLRFRKTSNFQPEIQQIKDKYAVKESNQA